MTRSKLWPDFTAIASCPIEDCDGELELELQSNKQGDETVIGLIGFTQIGTHRGDHSNLWMKRAG